MHQVPRPTNDDSRYNVSSDYNNLLEPNFVNVLNNSYQFENLKKK